MSILDTLKMMCHKNLVLSLSTFFIDLLCRGFDAAIFHGSCNQEVISSDHVTIEHMKLHIQYVIRRVSCFSIFGNMRILHLLTFLGPFYWKYLLMGLNGLKAAQCFPQQSTQRHSVLFNYR